MSLGIGTLGRLGLSRGGLRPQFFADFLTEIPSSSAVITYSGGANGTRVNSAGVIVNEVCPRIDYDPVTLACRGLLVEEQRTNLCTPSNDFSNARWTKIDTVITGGQSSPDGGTNGFLATEGTAGTSTVAETAVTVTAGQPVTYSRFVRRGNTDWVRMTVNGAAGTTRGWFNLATGAIGVVASTGTDTGAVGAIQAFGGGWFRVSVTTTNPTDTARQQQTMTALADNNTGRVSNGTYFTFGAQTEQGAFPTSYIPTAGSAVTRTADEAIATISLNGNPSTLFAEFSVPVAIASDFPALVRVDDTSPLNQLQLYAVTNGSGLYNAGCLSRLSGVNGINTATGTLSAVGAVGKVVAGFAAGDSALTYNGAALATSASANVPGALNRIVLGNEPQSLSRHIRRILYWNQRLPNETLRALTT